jgi:hypothetical protein
MRAFLFIGPPTPVVKMNQNERGFRTFHREWMSATERNFRGVADQGFTLDSVWREEPVFDSDPTAAHGHATRDQKEKLGELAT